ncbi:MAG: SDR family oxidoreductase [Planctomycetaceae bacterium]|nr:SDR family oxidoreductase [Planctomycetaceae bacterium]
MLNSFADQWALVTGASSGIGAEYARQLAALGMHLVLTARRRTELEELAQELHTKHACRCEVISVDIAEPGGVEHLIGEIAQKGITLELLVNNAGFGNVGEVDEADVERMLQLVRLNVAACVNLTYRVLPGMLERGHGAIINMSSLSAFQPVAYMAAYAASKAFVLHFSEALAIEVRPRGITILAVCPGVTRTPFFDIAGAPGWLQKHSSHAPERVVRDSLKALRRRRQVIVIGWRNYLLTLLVRMTSRSRVVKESMRFFRPRRKPTDETKSS